MFLLLLTGCAGSTAYVFVNEAPNAFREELARYFHAKDMSVEFVDTAVPEGLNKNIIITSYLPRDPGKIVEIQRELRELGIDIEEVLIGSRDHNHHYSGDNIGVYIVSGITQSNL
ncbi:MAG: hypothetical protein KDI36_12355 [Pseudomonadales bacterium]|nr:hypothetical protein [Pseudomonadales bacterium]